nr:unnamed protein product [Digitaria exilis]
MAGGGGAARLPALLQLAVPSPARLDWSEVRSTANRRRRRRTGEGERKVGDALRRWNYWGSGGRRDEGEVHARLCRALSPLGIIIRLHPPPHVPHALPDTWARAPLRHGYVSLTWIPSCPPPLSLCRKQNGDAVMPTSA